jgi:hypothetical protein
MLHQKIDTTVCLLPTNPLRAFIERYQEGLSDAAALLAGRRGSRIMSNIVEGLSSGYPLTRTTKSDLNDLLDILSLQHVHDPEREEAGRFAMIHPEDPCVEEICLLADGLHDVMRRVGVLSRI